MKPTPPHDPALILADSAEAAGLALRRAITNLWRHFGKTTGSAGWSDMAEDMARVAESKTLVQLTQEEYEHLGWHAMCWDRSNPDAVQYFLPRFLEDISTGHLAGPVPAELLMQALVDSNWQAWKPIEVEPVHRWFVAMWDRAMWQTPRWFGGDAARPASEVFQWLAYVGVDVPPFMQAWQTHRSPYALLHLVSFILDCDWPLQTGALGWDKVWDSEVPASVQSLIIRWLQSAEIRDWLERAFFETTDAEIGRWISMAIEMLPAGIEPKADATGQSS